MNFGNPFLIFPPTAQESNEPYQSCCADDPGCLLHDSSCCSGLSSVGPTFQETEILSFISREKLYSLSFSPPNLRQSEELESEWKQKNVSYYKPKFIERRSYGEFHHIHWWITKASSRNKHRIHSWALFSLSCPEGSNNNVPSCPFVEHILLWPFLYRAVKWLFLNWTSCRFPIQLNNVIDCGL